MGGQPHVRREQLPGVGADVSVRQWQMIQMVRPGHTRLVLATHPARPRIHILTHPPTHSHVCHHWNPHPPTKPQEPPAHPPVYTPCTPGMAAAAAVSMRRMRACGRVDSTRAACRAPGGSLMSSTYCAAPQTCARVRMWEGIMKREGQGSPGRLDVVILCSAPLSSLHYYCYSCLLPDRLACASWAAPHPLFPHERTRLQA